MNLLVIGGGGREHAIVRKLKENPEVETIYCLPGNGGIAADAVCVADIGAKDIPAQVAFAKSHDIDFAVVAPDDPLVLGVTATAQDLRSAVEKAYTMVQSVRFDNAFYRHDIGQRALKALEQ